MNEYIAKPGDTIQKIALRHKLDWEVVWQHSGNARLRETRKEPNLLLPGDKVVLPERDIRQEACATDTHHRFRAKGNTTLLRLRLLDEEGRPMAGTSYQLLIGGAIHEGSTDADGNLEQSISALTIKATLHIPSLNRNLPLYLGRLGPADAPQGIQERLRNLGYYHNRDPKLATLKLAAALRKFQKEHGLEQNGKTDAATIQKIEELHAY
jgi:N-acetylmuramoyl-L-alanine amidase